MKAPKFRPARLLAVFVVVVVLCSASETGSVAQGSATAGCEWLGGYPGACFPDPNLSSTDDVDAICPVGGRGRQWTVLVRDSRNDANCAGRPGGALYYYSVAGASCCTGGAIPPQCGGGRDSPAIRFLKLNPYLKR